MVSLEISLHTLSLDGVVRLTWDHVDAYKQTYTDRLSS